MWRGPSETVSKLASDSYPKGDLNGLCVSNWPNLNESRLLLLGTGN